MTTAPKNNHRSIRFTDEVAKIIEAQEGDNFNQKLENLINECYLSAPRIKKEINSLELYKKKLYDDIDELKQKAVLVTNKHRLLETSLNRYEYALNEAIEQLEKA